nr:SGNH/GDSL hydrolase family protein [Actinomycetales bacterium]
MGSTEARPEPRCPLLPRTPHRSLVRTRRMTRMPRPVLRWTTAAIALATAALAVPPAEAQAARESASAARYATPLPAATEIAPHAARGAADRKTERRHLVGAWSAATSRVPAVVGGQTIRMVVRISIGGTEARIRLSNVFGTRPVTFGRVRLGIQRAGARIKPGTNRSVTFGGRKSVTVAPGRAVWSDPIRGRFPRGSDLVISIYVPHTVRDVTGHERAYATTYLSRPGDHTRAESATAFTYTSVQWYFLDRVAVTAPATTRAVVAFGDSLTDGTGQEIDANRRWTDYLSHRLARVSARRRLSVLNAGIAGNRLLEPNVGPSGLSRFRRDALLQPGVRTVVVFIGINDISRGSVTSAQQLIDGYQRLIKAARAKRVRVLGATLTPFGGYATWTPEREEIRQQVNEWIRTSRAFDGVVDFDRAVRDPDAPDRLHPAYDAGDHLHMSDAGRKRLAYALNLRLL